MFTRLINSIHILINHVKPHQLKEVPALVNPVSSSCIPCRRIMYLDSPRSWVPIETIRDHRIARTPIRTTSASSPST